jgi:hypothetical protein
MGDRLKQDQHIQEKEKYGKMIRKIARNIFLYIF